MTMQTVAQRCCRSTSRLSSTGRRKLSAVVVKVAIPIPRPIGNNNRSLMGGVRNYNGRARSMKPRQQAEVQRQQQVRQQSVLNCKNEQVKVPIGQRRSFSLTAFGNGGGRRQKATLTLSHLTKPSTTTTTSAVSSAAASAGRMNGSSMFSFLHWKEFVFRFRDMKVILLRPRTIPIPRWVSPKHHSITLSEIFGHASFILVAASYAVDDFIMLRCIAVVASTSMLVFTYFHPHGRVLWLPFKWNLLFITLNSYRIGKVFLDKYLAEKLNDELIQLRKTHFYLMNPIDFARLANSGTMEILEKGDIITNQGEPNRYVRVILEGHCNVLRDGQINYLLEEGNFMSEVGLHAGLLLKGDVESCCTIQASTGVRILKWDRTELVQLLNRHSRLRSSFKAVLSWDIMRKLKAQRKLLADGRIVTDPEQWAVRRHDQGQHRYAAILKNMLSCPNAFAKLRKEQLNKYRMIHQIDDETHMLVLKQCGWTPEEFEAGQKFKFDYDYTSSSYGNIATSIHHQYKMMEDDFSWHLRDILLRIVGK